MYWHQLLVFIIKHPHLGKSLLSRLVTRSKREDTLCVIEAMKNMIEVKSDKDGQIDKILGLDGEPVDEGQALFIFKGE